MEKENQKMSRDRVLFLLNLNMGIFKDPLSRDEMQFWKDWKES